MLNKWFQKQLRIDVWRKISRSELSWVTEREKMKNAKKNIRNMSTEKMYNIIS